MQTIACNFIADGNICDAKPAVIDNFVANQHMPTIKLTTEDFKDNVFNYENEKEWKYKGTLPAIIDFYADWCGPCKMVAPVLEELAAEYEGKLVIYKVDTETEMDLASAFGIQSIPTFLFIPVGADPMIQPGAVPKKIFKEIIDGQLLAKS